MPRSLAFWARTRVKLQFMKCDLHVTYCLCSVLAPKTSERRYMRMSSIGSIRKKKKSLRKTSFNHSPKAGGETDLEPEAVVFMPKWEQKPPGKLVGNANFLLYIQGSSLIRTQDHVYPQVIPKTSQGLWCPGLEWRDPPAFTEISSSL